MQFINRKACHNGEGSSKVCSIKGKILQALTTLIRSLLLCSLRQKNFYLLKSIAFGELEGDGTWYFKEEDGLQKN